MSIVKNFLGTVLGGAPSAPPPSRRRNGQRASLHHKKNAQRTKGNAGRVGIRKSNPRSGGKRQQRPKRPPLPKGRPWAGVAYHGTPSVSNAKSICRHGFMIGNGNAAGDGIYLSTKVGTAKGYAGLFGCYLRCRVRLARICTWSPALQSHYAAWCRSRGVRDDNSARTAYLIQRGFDGVVNGDVIVVLSPQYANPTAWKRKRSKKVRVLSVHRARDGRVLKV